MDIVLYRGIFSLFFFVKLYCTKLVCIWTNWLCKCVLMNHSLLLKFNWFGRKSLVYLAVHCFIRPGEHFTRIKNSSRKCLIKQNPLLNKNIHTTEDTISMTHQWPCPTGMSRCWQCLVFLAEGPMDLWHHSVSAACCELSCLSTCWRSVVQVLHRSFIQYCH